MKDVTTGIKIAVLLILILMAYLTAATFVPMTEAGEEQAKTISPFLLGIIATLVGFYWGNSSKRGDQNLPNGAITSSATKTETVTESKTDPGK
jgi:hypothetical protein